MHFFTQSDSPILTQKKKLLKTKAHEKCTQICVACVKGQKVQPFPLIFPSYLKTEVKSGDLALTWFLNGIMSAFCCQPP